MPNLPGNAKGKVWVASIPEGLNKFYTLYDKAGLIQSGGSGVRFDLHVQRNKVEQ